MSLLATLLFILMVYLMIVGAATAAQYLYFRHNRKGTAPSASRRALIVLDCFAGVTALMGMAILLTGWGYRFPTSWLQGTPFSDYTVPALLLGIVVGGSALVAMVATIKSARIGTITSMIAGVIMMGYIIVEYVLVSALRFDFANPAASVQQGNQQPLWFLIGLVMAVLALRVVPGGVRDMLHTAHPA